MKPKTVFLILCDDGQTFRIGYECGAGEKIVGLRIPIPAGARIIHGGISSPWREELTIPDGATI